MAELPSLLRLPDRFEGRELLGEGGAGVVVLALDRLHDELVAIKVVHANLAVHARFRARFAREVTLSSQVVHPHVVPVRDIGRLADGRPFVVLAYADRGSFESLLAEAPPLQEALRIVDQVLDALGALHARGLLHQDLKPANVLLATGPDGAAHAWVADLGVAGDRTELAMNRKGISGTPTWMAPEQLSGQGQELGPWTDLYPVGLMLYEMLGGALDRNRVGSRLGHGKLPPLALPPGVPEALVQVVANLVQPDPRQRYDRAADVRMALRSAARGLEADLHARIAAARQRRSTTIFPDTILPEGQAPVARLGPEGLGEGVPRWNRVPPPPMPARPPAHGPGLEPSIASPQVRALREAALVGRDSLVRRLWTLGRKVVQTGEPQVALIIGESGSGKSRLAHAIARQLDAGGWAENFTLRYHFPAGVEDGYRGTVREILAPWNDTRFEVARRLQRWLARDQGVTLARTAGEAGVLARWCGYVSDSELPVNAAVGLAFLYRHLDVRAWRGGACLVLEDVHLAEAPGDGLHILESLLERSVGERPVLALATLSSEALARDPKLSAKVAALQRLGAVRIAAPRLHDREIAAMLERDQGLDPQVAQEVGRAARGSPSFAKLLMRDWAARGHLVVSPDGTVRLTRGTTLEECLPASIQDLCAQRVEGALDAIEQRQAAARALAAAALAGQEPPMLVVQEVDRQGLDALLSTGLVEQRGWRLVFEHPGVHRVARRQALARADMAELHRALAEAWAQLGKHTGIDVDLPHGLHRLHAGQSDRAVAPLLRAARTTLAEGRPNLAIDAGRLAIAAADRSGVAMARVEARQRMAEALLDLDRPQEATGVLDAARRGTHLDRRSRANVDVLGARAAIATGELDRARALLDRAATTFEATRDWKGLVDTAHGQGALFRLEGRPDDAADRFSRMLRINRGKNTRAEVLALVGLIEARIAAGRLSGLGREVTRLREVATGSGDTRNIAHATYVGGLLHLRRRDLQQADRYFQTARALAATLGAGRLHLSCINNLGEVARYRGDLAQASRCYEQAERLASEQGWAAVGAVARLNLGVVALHTRQDALALEHIERATQLLHDHPRHWGWLFIGLVRAMSAAQAGDHRTCQGWWSVAVERGLGRVQSPDLWIPLERLGTAAAAHGWTDIARRAAQLAQHTHTGEVDLLIEE